MIINGTDIDLIFLSLAGSHLYGTNTPDSDIDLRGVCFSPIENLLGLEGFEQYDFHTNTKIYLWKQLPPLESDDITIYSLQKFAKLCADGNPNIVELLFSKDSTYYASHTWNQISAMTDLFLSQKVRHTFSGYAFSQLSRIKTYTKWKEKAPEKPNPDDYGITQNDKGGYDWTSSILKNTYDNRLKEFQNYTEWLTNRNPYRRRLEEEFGYDTKHASHLVRLILEGVELLSTGKIILPLKDETRRIILDVKEGKWEYDKLIQESEKGFDWLKNMPSSLSMKPDRKAINELVIRMELDRIKGA